MGLFNRLQDEMTAREKSPGLTMSDIFALPDSSCRLLSWMIRQGQVDVETVARFLEQDEKSAGLTLSNLVKAGYVREIALPGQTAFRVRLAQKQNRKGASNLWKAIEDTQSD